MSEPTPVENMQTLRDAMVERRRDLASDIIRRNKTNNEPLSGAEGRCSQIAASNPSTARLLMKKQLSGPGQTFVGSYGRS